MMTRPEEITDQQISDFIKRALDEDIRDGDHTALATISETAVGKMVLKVKDIGILAGVDIAQRVFQHLDPSARFNVFKGDGSDVLNGDIAFEVVGQTRALLMGERTALNTMQRMSGIATLASRFAFEVGDLPVKILDTRKTTPTIRFLEKWAVRIGGCENYRWGLYDWFMIKDNHVDASGGIKQAIDRVHAYMDANNKRLNITLEVRNLVEVHEALEAGGITRIMFDNFELPILKEAVETVGRRFQTEASGGITLDNVRRYALTGVDYISSGALTHSAIPLDLSLKIVM